MPEWNNTMKWVVANCDNPDANMFHLMFYLKQEKNTELSKVSPLHLAATGINSSIVKTLLSNGFDINCKDNEGATPLHWACSNDNKLMVELFINLEANLLAKDHNGNTPLHFATERGHTEIVQLLIEKYLVDINIPNNKGKTPLQIACEEEDEYTIQYLLSKSAKIEKSLNDCILRNQPLIVRLLVKFGAIEKNKIHNGIMTNPLQEAIKLERSRIVKVLLHYSSWMADIRNIDGKKPLDFVTTSSHKKLLLVLQKHNKL